MAGSGRHGSGTPRTLTGMTALREVKNAETEVREKKEEAQEEASTILAEARKEARSVLQDSKEDAESEAERIILDARDEAQEEKENILRDAEARPCPPGGQRLLLGE